MRGLPTASLALLLGTCLLPPLAVAQEAKGYGEVRISFFPGVTGEVWQLVERVRPTFEAPIGKRVKMVATVEAALSQGRDSTTEVQNALENSDFGPLLDAAGCTWLEHENHLLGIDGSDDYLDVDRLYIDAYLPRVDLRLGRQSIHWGSASFLNPTDPFPELLLTEPWRPRKGLNALRATFSLPAGIDATAVLATNDTFDAVRGAGRVRGTVKGFDLAVAGGYRGDGGENGEGDGLVGIDVKGTLGVGVWVEASLHLGKDREDLYEQIAAGLDYSFPVLEGLVVSAQYYRNGGGASREEDLSQTASLSSGIEAPTCDAKDSSTLFGTTSVDPFAPLLARQNYLLISAGQRFAPEVSVSVAALQSLDDGTGMLLPSLTVVPLGWLEISASAQIPFQLWGNGGEFRPGEDDLVVEADLGGGNVLTADLSGLVPDATLTLWTRINF